METYSFLYFLGLPLENPILFLGIFMVVISGIIYYRMQNNNEMDNVEENSASNTDIIMGPIVYFIDGRSPSRHEQRFCI